MTTVTSTHFGGGHPWKKREVDFRLASAKIDTGVLPRLYIGIARRSVLCLVQMAWHGCLAYTRANNTIVRIDDDVDTRR